MSPTSASLSDRIRLILRRDLKVAASIPLDDDTPLFGSHTDLDSLDALLLVSSIEKELGYKIPNERIGRETFRTIGTLASFLAANLHEAPAAVEGASPIDMNAAMARLPHGPAFRYITALTSLEPGLQGEGVWEITGVESFLAGHFPGDPIVPGVLIVEALAQLSGVVAAASIADGGVKAGRIAQVEVRFEREVRPAVQLRLRSRVSQKMDGLWRFDVSAASGDDVVSQGQITMSLS